MHLDEMIRQHTANLSPQLKAEVFDFILFMEQKQNSHAFKNKTQSKQQLKQALESAVNLGVFANVDGEKWQQQQRQDKALFGRED